MLQTLREKTTGWVAILVIGLLAVPFAFFGMENYFTSNVATYVAKVGDEEIPQEEFRQRFDQYRAQTRRMMGENFNAAQFEDPTVKRRFLDQLIEEKLLAQTAAERGIVVPAQVLREEIRSIPAFQVDGNFDANRYRMILAGQNMTVGGFQEQMRRDLSVQLLPGQIVETGFVTDAYLDRYLRLRDQRRDIEYVVLAPPSAEDVGVVDDAAIEAWYQANPEHFMSEERVTIEYLQVLPGDIEVPMEVDEQTLRQRYEEQRMRFVEPAARLASHILVSAPADADADAVQAAQREAASIAQAARAEGADFAALAAEHSDDLGSKSSGGELGWIERGLLSPAFEDALFALEAGQVSDPVKTDDGWHVIRVHEVREETGQDFEQARAELEREYLETERERRFSDISGQMVDLVYRDPTTLDTASAELGLQVQQAGPFTRAGGEGIAADPAVVEAAFSEPVLVGGNVSDPVELAEGGVAMVRVAAHEPSRPLPLDEVREQVRTLAQDERIAAAARSAAEQALAQLQSGTALQEIADGAGAKVEQADEITRNAMVPERPIVARAFELAAPADGAPSPGMAELSNNRFALLQLDAVRDGDPSVVESTARTALREQLGRAVAGVEARAFVDALRKDAKVTVVEERL